MSPLRVSSRELAHEYLAAARKQLRGLGPSLQHRRFPRGPVEGTLAKKLPRASGTGLPMHRAGVFIRLVAVPVSGSIVTGRYRKVPHAYELWYPGGYLRKEVGRIRLRPISPKYHGRREGW